MKDYLEYLINRAIRLPIRSVDDLLALKRSVCKKRGVESAPANILILNKYRRLVKQGKIRPSLIFERILRKRAVRTLSGVAIVAVMTKSSSCPGKCFYCPTERKMPKSYLSNEPAVMRAILNNFDPYWQVKNRLAALQMTGHSTDKCELIVIGGTWSALDKKYQAYFIKRCLDGFNGRQAKNLEQAKKWNEKAKNRMIGLTLETRPDYVDLEEVRRMRKLGATRVELGVQITDDAVLKKNNRQSGVEDIVRATRILREAGLKITYHIMPNLYGSNPKKDLVSYKKLFKDPRFQPDQVKIYPCLVTKNSALYKLYRLKKYRPYSEDVLKRLLIEMKKATPAYVRISRLIRDIPKESIIGGNKVTNLRQLLQAGGAKCQCIRCREAGIRARGDDMLVKRTYQASGGKEVFISFESKDKKILYAFLRLRLQKDKTVFIRELHTYGEVAPLENKKGKVQHLGFGKRLMREAEKIAKKEKAEKILVIAGVGVRGYYKKLGYKLVDDYMVKIV